VLALVACGSLQAATPKKVVLIAGTVHQGPAGHPAGTHEYELSARLLKQALLHGADLAPLQCEVHVGGWPGDPRTLDDADSIVLISDGADRNEQDHPLLVGERLKALKKQMDRGCGLVALHWTLFVPRERGGEEFLEWIGGFFDYQSGDAANHWYSRIQTAATRPEPATSAHAISRGLKPFDLREEYYYRIRFRERDPRLTPILKTKLPGEPDEQVVAWAVERRDGGRGFGFTGGHFFENWGVEDFRRMVLNAIVWTAHVDVPQGGVRSSAPAQPEKLSSADEPAIDAVIVTGYQHPAHAWRETTVALQEALADDRRFQVSVVTDPEFLATKNLHGYQVVLFNYCNWQRPGLSEEAKANLQSYLAAGGGLAIIHFANGAFHSSLPETPPSDWPEYRAICRRVWDHAAGRSSHDPYGRFTVNIVGEHPITAGMNSFEAIDELYCNQQGELPIEVLATAHSKVSGKDEPMAFVYPYGKGRVFQTVLGHAAESIRTPGESTLIRRGAVWAAGREQRAAVAKKRPVPGAIKLIPGGRFGAALDPRTRAVLAEHRPIYDKRPLSVECWARVLSKAGFNILVASNAKESGEHWELYTYAGAGDLSLFVPGFAPAEIRSGVDIADGKWHFVAAAFDEHHANLYVDGKLVKQAQLSRVRSGGPVAPLFFGGYPPHQIGCDGLVDDVRISNVCREAFETPSAPLAADEHTIGLWHFDRIEAGKVEDASPANNPALAQEGVAAGGPLATRHPIDPAHELTVVDSSPDESFLSMRADTAGRLFAGGREALFVYEPDGHGGFETRKLLFRFPADTWITDILVRGDDLYVMTNAALYLVPDGRIARANLVPKRLLWGTPVDLHVTWHGLAWGPEGDLYFSSGDPLLNYGDFANRPDHWGHWTVYGPDGAKYPYTGVGGFFRCRPDGTRFRSVAGGTRGAVGIAFDRRWQLFSNDNDHESIADRYSPARLLHVTAGANFFWPRGWIADMSPERSDLLDVVNGGMGREAPVGQAYFDEPGLGDGYRDSLLVARWGQRKVDGYKLAKRGATFSGREIPLIACDDIVRPVGVAVGGGGRVFAALSYMAANEWSPKYPSEIVMISSRAASSAAAFEPYDATRVSPERLWNELSASSTWRRQQAHAEILRRGEPLLSEAIARIAKTGPNDVAMLHLPWIAAASGKSAARDPVVGLTRHADVDVRLQAVRALCEFDQLGARETAIELALDDKDAHVQHAGVATLLRGSGSLPKPFYTGPARSEDPLLRQTSAFVLANRANSSELSRLLKSTDARDRLVGVLAAGFRLTIPPVDQPLPDELPLKYESTNALFTINYADASVDLKKLGRTGSFTTADLWKLKRNDPTSRELFAALLAMLDDPDDRVQYQAGYFLWLLNDEQANDKVVASRRKRTLERLESRPGMQVAEVWMFGPLGDSGSDLQTVHAPEKGPIDLAEQVQSGKRTLTWRTAGSANGINLDGTAAKDGESSYLYFRVQTLEPQPALLRIAGANQVRCWNNGQPIARAPFLISLEPGSNDVLLRLVHESQGADVHIELRSRESLAVRLPEKLAASNLADRLRSAQLSADARVPEEFLTVDWRAALAGGDAERGRRLFGAAGLGCAKCHAILPNQRGGGGPSLADAARRFTLTHVVESVLLPSKQVADVFGTTTLALDDGKTVSGLAVHEDENKLVLLLPSAARQEVAKSTIEARKLQPVSPMPTGLVKTPAELGDLLAYLMSPHPQAP
jgi:putative heme-binding domain-containing protein